MLGGSSSPAAGQFKVLVAAAATATAARGHAVFEGALGALAGLLVLFGCAVCVGVGFAGPAAATASTAAAATAAAGVLALGFFVLFLFGFLGNNGAGRMTVLRSGAWKIIEVTAPGARKSEGASDVSADASAAGCSVGRGLGGSGLRSRPVGGYGGVSLGRGRGFFRGCRRLGRLARVARRRTGFSAVLPRRPAARRDASSAGTAVSGCGRSAKAGRGVGLGLLPRPVRRAGAFASGFAASGSVSGGCVSNDVGRRGGPQRGQNRRPCRLRGCLAAGPGGLLAAPPGPASRALFPVLLRQQRLLRYRLQPGHYPYVATLLPLMYRHIRHPWGKYLSTPAGIDRSQLDTPRFAPAVGCGSPGGPARLFWNPLTYSPQPGAVQWHCGTAGSEDPKLPCSSLAVLKQSRRTGIRMWIGFQPRFIVSQEPSKQA